MAVLKSVIWQAGKTPETYSLEWGVVNFSRLTRKENEHVRFHQRHLWDSSRSFPSILSTSFDIANGVIVIDPTIITNIAVPSGVGEDVTNGRELNNPPI